MDHKRLLAPLIVITKCLKGSLFAALFLMFHLSEASYASNLNSQGPKERTSYVRSVYQALPAMISILLGSDTLSGEESDFLKSLEATLSKNPPLQFIKNSPGSFIIHPNPTQRLMRSHPDPSGPIYVNQDLLNSASFNLDLPQLIKLLLHELSHKTLPQTQLEPERISELIALNDKKSQSIEDQLRLYYFQSEKDSDRLIEGISLPLELIQFPLTENPYKLQPNYWVFAHSADSIENLTPKLSEYISNNLLLTRTIGTEILTVITELSNTFLKILKDRVASQFDQFTNMFSEPGEEPIDSFSNSIDKMNGPIKAMSLIEIKRVNSVNNEVLIDADLVFARSHIKKGKFNINGFPWRDSDRFPVQIKSKDRITFQLLPKTNYKDHVKVGRISRQGSQLRSLEVTFQRKTFPYTVDLALEYPGGTIRLNASKREALGSDSYRATFEFNSSEFLKTSFTERIYVDNEEVLFLDRRISVDESNNENFTKPLTSEEILSDSIGIWGLRGTKWSLENKFSHLKSPIVFFITPPTATDHFVINPYKLMVEFEIKSEIEISTAELFWSSEQMIFDTTNSEHPIIPINEKIDGVVTEQRYAAAGSLLESETLRESILFTTERLKILPSERPGYKKVRLSTITPLKHLRPLKNKNEAHRLPNATPISLKITTKDLRTHFHSFPSSESNAEFDDTIKMNCDQLLKAAGSSGR